MPADVQTPTISNKAIWAGRIISALLVLFMLGTAIYSLMNPAAAAKQMSGDLGYPEHLARVIAVLEIVCVLIYALPQTSILGAILLTGYLGGAVASHVRVSESPLMPIVFGVLVWLGLVLRDARLRTLLPRLGSR